MYLVLRRGAIDALAVAGELAGSAAVACLQAIGDRPEYAEALAGWRARPGKVCLRARNQNQWEQVLELPHALAGERDGASVLALPPMRRSERPELLEKLQAMSGELEPLPDKLDPALPRKPITYLVNPRLEMSSGKTIAQIAHAATGAAAHPQAAAWIELGCPANVISPPAAQFDAMRDRSDLAARVVDAGLTEVAPGTVTVLAAVTG